MTPKYPDIAVKLTGEDGNAFAIIGRVRRALPADVRGQFADEAMSGDYDNVLRTAMKWVNVT